jgi:hypothetical protein
LTERNENLSIWIVNLLLQAGQAPSIWILIFVEERFNPLALLEGGKLDTVALLVIGRCELHKPIWFNGRDLALKNELCNNTGI